MKLRKITKMTNWDGTYPQHNCKQCDKPLSETERFAGIYTGICNSCMYLPAYIIVCYKIDNCLIISHPPNSPAHRRNRREHHAYIDCFVCNGKGCILNYRSYASRGSYYRYCKNCLDRYYAHPMRKSFTADNKEIELTKLQPYKVILNTKFVKALPETLQEKQYSEYTEEDKVLWTNITKPFRDDFDDYAKSVTRICDLIYDEAYEKVEYKPGAIFLLDH